MFNPIYLYKISHILWRCKVPKLPHIIQEINWFLTGCELPPQVTVGKRVRFQHHGMGVIIHCCTVIGDDVIIHPYVVVGQNVRSGVAVPIKRILIGNGVQIGTGAKIIASANLTIGNNCDIGANAVVLKSVLENNIAVGIPARNILK